jgi:hypothetical protein
VQLAREAEGGGQRAARGQAEGAVGEGGGEEVVVGVVSGTGGRSRGRRAGAYKSPIAMGFSGFIVVITHIITG